ncbi:MAG: M24 family metallopeptidase [Burkholderiaceae bacterium]|nr:M24 family metallopeptidase [Burkholderiaceae bacterium]
MSIVIKTPADVAGMRLAGRLAAEVLDYITPFVRPGVTTGELDRLCHEYMLNVQGSIPAPLNYAPPVTYECMWLGIAQVRPGATIGDIGHAIQTHAEKHGYSVVREFCGHGIGRKFHEEPQILHYGKPGTLERLTAGMTFTVEPMINAGRREIKELADGWTIVTKDHSLSAQWEHTVLVTASGVEVLTRSAGTPPPPAFVNVAWHDSPEPATA